MSTPTDDDDSDTAARCRAAPLLAILGARWTPALLHLLGTRGPTRFNALQRALAGISPKVLVENLRTLEQAGLVWRAASDDVPPEVHYGLTARGLEVHGSLGGLDDLARRDDPG